MAAIEKALRRLVDETMELKFQAEETIAARMEEFDVPSLLRNPNEMTKRFVLAAAQAAIERVGDKAVEAGGRFGKAIRGSQVPDA